MSHENRNCFSHFGGLMTKPEIRSRAPSAAKLLALFASISTCGYPMLAHGQQADPCAAGNPPTGAQALGYSHQVFCVAPTMADISVVNGVSSKLYSGKWYDKVAAPMSLYSMSGQTLALSSGGYLMTETRQSQPGALPLLLASAGFYVEFAVHLSDNDPDHFPAVWLMPQEHNASHSDHMPSDPQGFERWMEIDVDEGGYNTGHLGTLINWYGTSPSYQHQNESNAPASTFGMDRTQEHIFGLSYDPVGKKVTWYVDGVAVGSASTAMVPQYVNTHHYYLIMSNQSHGLNRPYQMYVRYFSAWIGSTPPKSPTGVRAETTQ